MGENIGVTDAQEQEEIPGTAKIRKLGSLMSPMELLQLSAKLAQGGYDKKLWSVLSRVYEDKKFLDKKSEENETIDRKAVAEAVNAILAADVPAELKLQTFTSFHIPTECVPDKETVSKLIAGCTVKRLNIAAYFLADYSLELRQYDDLIANRVLFRNFLKAAKQLDLIKLYGEIFQKESKEFITGSLRQLAAEKRHYRYPDYAEIQELTNIAFASKQVFFTTKLLYCITFDVPKTCLPAKKDVYDILKISINYEEKISREFADKYDLNFNSSDSAICRYYLNNRKTQKEQDLVRKFATHLVNVEDEVEKSKLLHFAFKRGGLFRMYAGCMQDGEVNVEKQKRFHYTDEQIAWVSSLPGLKK